MEEKAKLAAGLKQRLANLISQKNRFMKAATELQAENSQLEAQLDATGGSGGGRPSADELRSRIAVLEGERVVRRSACVCMPCVWGGGRNRGLVRLLSL